jgi:predicted TIM-barrel fold metal-dependent hydrolase
MYGSGYPHWSMCTPFDAVRGLNAEQQQKVLWRNACTLYEIGAQKHGRVS